MRPKAPGSFWSWPRVQVYFHRRQNHQRDAEREHWHAISEGPVPKLLQYVCCSFSAWATHQFEPGMQTELSPPSSVTAQRPCTDVNYSHPPLPSLLQQPAECLPPQQTPDHSTQPRPRGTRSAPSSCTAFGVAARLALVAETPRTWVTPKSLAPDCLTHEVFSFHACSCAVSSGSLLFLSDSALDM